VVRVSEAENSAEQDLDAGDLTDLDASEPGQDEEAG